MQNVDINWYDKWYTKAFSRGQPFDQINVLDTVQGKNIQKLKQTGRCNVNILRGRWLQAHQMLNWRARGTVFIATVQCYVYVNMKEL